MSAAKREIIIWLIRDSKQVTGSCMALKLYSDGTVIQPQNMSMDSLLKVSSHVGFVQIYFEKIIQMLRKFIERPVLINRHIDHTDPAWIDFDGQSANYPVSRILRLPQLV